MKPACKPVRQNRDLPDQVHRMSFFWHITFTLLLLLVSIWFFGYFEGIDLSVQDLLYDTQAHQWILERDTQPYRMLFYDGPKRLLLVFAFFMLVLLLVGKKRPWLRHRRKGLFILLLAALIVPQTVSLLKRYTNMPCPKHSIHYGGSYPHTAVWEHYPVPYEKLPPTKCWPAGHASGGFTLLALVFLFRSRKWQRRAAGFALLLGWIMGGYKMLIGDHYLSHTVISMLLSWLLILLIARAVGVAAPFNSEKALYMQQNENML